MYWPVGDGDLTGLMANLVVYYDADGDGDPTNAVRVGTDTLVLLYANQRGTETAEVMELDASGKVTRMRATYSG